MGQSLTGFKTTTPDVGEARFLWSGSTGPDTSVTASVIGMTISVFDCSSTSRETSISSLTEFNIGTDTLNLINPEAYNNYYYYDVSPIVTTGSLADYESVCTITNLTPPPTIDTFKNSPFNAAFNNALEIRRIQRTGSLAANASGVFVLDKKGDQIVPSNLQAVLSGSAVTASFQESNIYSKSWTLPRYEGSKLNSGSLFFNDPALTFTPFKGIKFPLLESSSYIRELFSTSSINQPETDDFFFNPPYNYERGLYEQGSTRAYPTSAQPVYEFIDNEYKRITKSKIYIPGTDDIIRLLDYQAQYEVRPSSDTSVPVASGDNIFTVMIETTKNIEYYSYYSSSGVRIDNVELRPLSSDVIYVSGSYVGPPVDAYALDVGTPFRSNSHPIFSLGGPALDPKTFITIMSSSNNL